MRVSGKSGGVGSTQGVSGPKSSSTAVPASVGSVATSDAVQVSSAARLVAVAQEALAGVPDIRMDKVEAIKNQLDADAYHPDGEAVADGIIKEHMARGRRS
jgi:flagellar biosynthesis anti-sigma factor FlgM